MFNVEIDPADACLQLSKYFQTINPFFVITIWGFGKLKAGKTPGVENEWALWILH